jgi:hypothetical protein
MSSQDERVKATTLWPQSRRRVCALTYLVAIVTAAYGATFAGNGAAWLAPIAVAYVVATAFASYSPSAIAAQVIAGFGLAWGVLQQLDGLAVFALVPLTVGVVATAELLGVVGRLGTIVERAASPDLRRLPAAAGVTAVISAATLGIGLLDVPGGLVGTLLAAGACVVLAVFLVGDRARDVR